jgi:hypothetical protein
MGMDVSRDCWVEHLRAWITSLQPLAKIGGGNVFMDGL